MTINDNKFVEINSHHLSVFMKDTAGRVLRRIREVRTNFVAENKDNDYKPGQDYVTNIDRDCQKVWLKHLHEQFPFVGVIAEEVDDQGKEFFLPCSNFCDTEIFATIDPLDGTNAFIRGQSEGFGTMFALLKRNEKTRNFDIIAMCIGDAMTEEFYYYRPNSKNVHRVEPGKMLRGLGHNTESFKNQYVLLRDDPRAYSQIVQDITYPKTGLFKNIEVASGSIGTNTAKLWKGQCGAYILKSGYDTPWDFNPVAGMSKKLGFKMFELKDNGLGKEIPLFGIIEKTKREYERIIIHNSKVPELKEFLKNL